MRENNKILIVIIMAVLLVGITVVFVVFPRSKGSEKVVTHPVMAEEVIVSDTEMPATKVQDTAEPTQSEVGKQINPTLRADLESTDPATVNLASGEIQLVEVFAFW